MQVSVINCLKLDPVCNIVSTQRKTAADDAAYGQQVVLTDIATAHT